MIHDTKKLKIDSRYDSWFDNYGADNVDPTVALPLSLYAMMQSFMTT